MSWSYIEMLGGGYVVDQRLITHAFVTGRGNLLQLVDHPAYGRTLYANGEHQSSQADEFIYHEALVHPAMACRWPAVPDVLILGGGEGATAREVLRWPVGAVTMVDYDRDAVDFAREFLPEWSAGAFEDARLSVHYQDAWDWLVGSVRQYDVAIIDLFTPCAESRAAYCNALQLVKDSMNEHGVVAGHAGPVHPGNCRDAMAALDDARRLFPYVSAYLVPELRWLFWLAMPDGHHPGHWLVPNATRYVDSPIVTAWSLQPALPKYLRGEP